MAFSARSASYLETLERLKLELRDQVNVLKLNAEWTATEKLYNAVRAVQDLAMVPRMTLDELLMIPPLPVNVPPPPASAAAKPSTLALGPQQEPEASTELEKGS